MERRCISSLLKFFCGFASVLHHSTGQTLAHAEFQACSAEVLVQHGKLCTLCLGQCKAHAAAVHEYLVDKPALLATEARVLATGVHVCLGSNLGIVCILVHGQLNAIHRHAHISLVPSIVKYLVQQQVLVEGEQLRDGRKCCLGLHKCKLGCTHTEV
jgi:hypothetical protein